VGRQHQALRGVRFAALATLTAMVGCSGGAAPGTEAQTPPPAVEVAPPTGDEAAILPRPFTAEEIRDEWVPGFQLTIRRSTGEGPTLERWTVASADASGAEIEYAPLDDAGNPAGQPRVERSTWIQLRDHATFPASSSRREEVTRDTALGRLDGWLYTVDDEAAGTRTELFFAKSLPGAPVQFRMTRGDDVVLELEQTARSRAAPDAPAAQ